MTKVGCSGHQGLPEAARRYADEALRQALSEWAPDLQGLSSLAAGADQLFAQAVLAAGGQLHVVIPSADYEGTLSGVDRTAYERFVAQATRVTTLDFTEPSEEAFLAAGCAIVDECDVLVAIWDGQPAKGLGGTADVVAYARAANKPVRVIWPAGVSR